MYQNYPAVTITPFYAGARIPTSYNTRRPLKFPGDKSKNGSESVADIWAKVPLAEINGFMMPIITPVEMNKERSIWADSRLRSFSSDTGKEGVNIFSIEYYSFWYLVQQCTSYRFPSEYLPIMCGEYDLVPGSSLSLSSPYYPANYPDNFSCRWSITVRNTREYTYHSEQSIDSS